MGISVQGGGALSLDANNNPIQAALDFLTEDATGTPIISAVSTGGTGVTTLTVPVNSVFCVIRAVGADLRVGTNTDLDGTATGKGYYLLPNGSAESFSVIGCSNIRYKRDAGTDVTVSFRFGRLQSN